MQPLDGAAIRASFVNASRKEASDTALPADLASLAWPKLTYLGWRDPKSPRRAAMVVHLDGGPADKADLDGAPSAGIASNGIRSGGVESGSVPATGVPSGGVPATGIPSGSVPATGVPSGDNPPGGDLLDRARLVGILLRQAEASPRTRAQCSLCQDVTLPNDVVFFGARRAGAAGRKGDTLGTLICSDFQCSANVRKQPVSAYLGFDVEAERQRRIAQLAERVAAFARAVIAGE